MRSSWHSKLEYITLIQVLVLWSVAHGSRRQGRVSSDLLFVGGFIFFILLVVFYHCFLKRQRRREVMTKILSEEDDASSNMNMVKFLADLHRAKVHIREKKAEMLRRKERVATFSMNGDAV